jgi:hypothetical protein
MSLKDEMKTESDKSDRDRSEHLSAKGETDKA